MVSGIFSIFDDLLFNRLINTSLKPGYPSVPLSAVWCFPILMKMSSTSYSFLCWLHAQSPWQSTNKANHLADVANSMIAATQPLHLLVWSPRGSESHCCHHGCVRAAWEETQGDCSLVSIRRFKLDLNCNPFRWKLEYYYFSNWLCKIYVPPVFKFCLFKISLKSALR